MHVDLAKGQVRHVIDPLRVQYIVSSQSLLSQGVPSKLKMIVFGQKQISSEDEPHVLPQKKKTPNYTSSRRKKTHGTCAFGAMTTLEHRVSHKHAVQLSAYLHKCRSCRKTNEALVSLGQQRRVVKRLLINNQRNRWQNSCREQCCHSERENGRGQFNEQKFPQVWRIRSSRRSTSGIKATKQGPLSPSRPRCSSYAIRLLGGVGPLLGQQRKHVSEKAERSHVIMR